MNTLRPPLKTIAQKLRETNPIIHVAVGNCIAGRYIEIRPQDDGALTLITFTRDPANPYCHISKYRRTKHGLEGLGRDERFDFSGMPTRGVVERISGCLFGV